MCVYIRTYVLNLQLIGGLADEKVRWAESVKSADKMLVNVIGDVMVASGAVSYLGAFTVRNNILCTAIHVHTYVYVHCKE